MCAFASILILTAITLIILHKSFHLPVLALFFIIIIEMRLAAVILPIMGIDTCISSVGRVTVRTPYRFEMEHVEIIIQRLHFVEYVNCKLALRMSEGTHVPILTRVNTVWVTLTKLHLILLRMIELLDTVVRPETIISEWAILITRSGKWTALTGVCTKGSSLVFSSLMVVEALLRVVLQDHRAVLGFEETQVKIFHYSCSILLRSDIIINPGDGIIRFDCSQLLVRLVLILSE